MKQGYQRATISDTSDPITRARKFFLCDILIDALLVSAGRRQPYRAWDSRSRAIAFIHSPQAQLWGELLGLNWPEILKRIEPQKHSTDTA